MRATALLPLLLCLGMAGAKLPPDLVQRYSQKMAFEQCYGKQNMDALKQRIMNAAAECWGVEPRPADPTFFFYPIDLATMVKETVYHYQVHPENLIRGPMSPVDFFVGEQVRGPEVFGVMECTLTRLGYMTKEGGVDYDFFRNWLKDMFADGSREVVKAQMLKSVDDCKSVSEVQASQTDGKYSLTAVQPGLFFDCMGDQKVRACIMQDVSDQLGSFINEDGAPNTMTLDETFAIVSKIF